MIESKFKIGDVVKVQFKGQIEGVSLVLYRMLYVTSLKLVGGNGSEPEYHYTVAEYIPQKNVSPPKTWDYKEYKLEEVDPCSEAIAKARGGLLPVSVTVEAMR